MKRVLRKTVSLIGAPFICTLLGSLGAIFIIPFYGITTALPLLPLCALALGFVKINTTVKTLIFALCGGIFAAGYSANGTDILIYATVCGVSAFLGTLTVKMFKKEKVRFWSVLPLAAMVALQLCFGGNLISYIKANKAINNYVDQTYDVELFEIEHLRYDYISQMWRAQISSKVLIGTYADIIAYNDSVVDNYVNLVEEQIMGNTRAELANLLRSAFPEMSFTVVSEGILNFGEYVIDENTLYKTDINDMVFSVYIGSLSDTDAFLKDCKNFRAVIEESDTSFGRVIFRGGGLGVYDMEQVYLKAPSHLSLTDVSRVKYNCGTVFEHRQDKLDRHFIKNEFLYD